MSRAARGSSISSRGRLALLSAAVLAVSAATASSALAQGGGFGMAVGAVARSSGFPTDWQRTNTLTTMTVFNSMDTTAMADIQVTIYKNGVLVGTTPSLAASYPLGTTLYATPQVTDWRKMGFIGQIGDAVDESGHLPDGVYQFCIDIRNIRTPTGLVAQDVQQCGQFLSIYPKPPTLLFPRDGSLVSVTQPIFQWTPVVSEVGRVLTYWYRLVEILPGQTPLQAIEANRSIYEQLINSLSSFPYPASAPLLQEGHRYAWRIQALYPVQTGRTGGISNNNLKAGFGSAAAAAPAIYPIGENEGRSKVFTFVWSRDPLHASDIQAGSVGAGGTQEGRMGSAWDADGARGLAYGDATAGAGAAGAGGAGGRKARANDESHSGGAASGENFADRLARVMASLWKKGPGAAAAAARSAGGWPAGGIAASAGTGGSRWREAADERIAQGPTGPGGAPGKEGVGPPPPSAATADATPAGAPADSASADDASHADATPSESAPVTTAAPSLEPPGVGPNWARLHGTASLSGETYSRDGSGEASRPDQSARVVTGLSVGILKDRMRIPVSALISDDQVSFRQNINQVAVAPKWQWAGLTAGNFSPQYSPYTLADATVLGAGLDLAPNKWRVGFLSGRARKAILPTLAAIVAPQFERNVTAGRIGYGEALANNVEFAIMRATDDPGSIAGAESTLTLTPEGNTVYSLKAQGVMPVRHLRAQIETALSKYDRDRRADAPSIDGHAVGLQLFHETSRSRMGLKAEYLNGGFMTLGNSGITGDRVDLGFNWGVQLLQGKLSLNGNAGLRNDAVTTTLAAETRRRNWGLNGSWQPDPRFGADAQFSVFQNESDAADSLLGGSSNVSRVYSVMPRANWVLRGVQNSFSVSATVQKSKAGGGPGVFLNNNSLSLLGSWSAVISAPWSVTFSGNYNKTDYDIAVMESSAFGPGFTWAAFRSKLLTNAQLQFTRTRTGNAGTDEEVTPRMEMRWEFAQRQALVLRANYRRFQYASPFTPEFNERIASLEYVTNL